METKAFVEAVRQSTLPFIYYDEKLNDEKCQKALKKIGPVENILAVITGEALVGLEGMAVTEKGITFSFSSGATGDMDIPKTKGNFAFDEFIIHDVSVKKGAIAPAFKVEAVIWEIRKKKSFVFHFNLVESDLKVTDEMAGELANILKTLIVKTGTEYEPSSSEDDESETPVVKNPNEFDFVYGSVHTIFAVNNDTIIIKRTKIDDKTKIQTPKGDPVTITRSALDSIKLKRQFSPVPLLGGMGVGAAIGFIIIGRFIVFAIGTLIGLIASFPKTMFIYRKDGTKYKTVIRGDEDEYERLISTIFK